MILIQGTPSPSTPVRIWRASGWKQAACRAQSRGPAGPEIMAYISSTTAPMATLSSMALVAGRNDDLHALVALHEAGIDPLGLAYDLDHREALEDLFPDDLWLDFGPPVGPAAA